MSAAPRRNARPQPIGDLLGRLLQRNGLARRHEAGAAFAAWEKVAPPAVGARTRALSFRGGKLVVAVRSAPLLEELRCFRAGEFLALLNQALAADPRADGVQVRALEFRRD